MVAKPRDQLVASKQLVPREGADVPVRELPRLMRAVSRAEAVGKTEACPARGTTSQASPVARGLRRGSPPGRHGRDQTTKSVMEFMKIHRRRADPKQPRSSIL
uniref:Uncharacterized protein n=1 Tax=Chloropicon primus TaxID=1764295 RepID=A0A7S2T3I0_9CHLO